MSYGLQGRFDPAALCIMFMSLVYDGHGMAIFSYAIKGWKGVLFHAGVLLPVVLVVEAFVLVVSTNFWEPGARICMSFAFYLAYWISNIIYDVVICERKSALESLNNADASHPPKEETKSLKMPYSKILPMAATQATLPLSVLCVVGAVQLGRDLYAQIGVNVLLGLAQLYVLMYNKSLQKEEKSRAILVLLKAVDLKDRRGMVAPTEGSTYQISGLPEYGHVKEGIKDRIDQVETAADTDGDNLRIDGDVPEFSSDVACRKSPMLSIHDNGDRKRRTISFAQPEDENYDDEGAKMDVNLYIESPQAASLNQQRSFEQTITSYVTLPQDKYPPLESIRAISTKSVLREASTFDPAVSTSPYVSRKDADEMDTLKASKFLADVSRKVTVKVSKAVNAMCDSYSISRNDHSSSYTGEFVPVVHIAIICSLYIFLELALEVMLMILEKRQALTFFDLARKASHLGKLSKWMYRILSRSFAIQRYTP
ncbi:hypothetical protein HDU67_001537 [Dinochytrium kinnereticum]|nr:hypothetical protein HDU67_001537 [Dinochytrium kinnereticum]